MSQTVLKQMPAGITPPTDPELQRLQRADPAARAVERQALRDDAVRRGDAASSARNWPRSPGAAIPLPYGGKVRQVQADLNQQALHTYGISANDVVNALSIQNLITPVGTQKIGTFEYTVNLNDSPSAIAAFNDLPIKTVNGTVIYMRDVAYVHDGSPPQTNVVHVDGKSAVLLSVVKAGATSTLSIISGIKQLLPSVAQDLAGQPESDGGRRPVGVRDQRRLRRDPRRRHRGRADRDDDPAVPRQLALDADHHRLDPACHPGLGDGALRCSARRSTS